MAGAARQRVLTGLVLLVVAGGALALRWPGRFDRPMHTDEAVHAWKYEALLQGRYRYDPVDFHGPALYYLTWPAWRLSGARTLADTDEATFRIAPALLGAATVLLLSGLISALGAGAVIVAALLLALSPALVFYSPCFIQETPLVFFTTALLVAGWRYVQHPGPAWAVVAGLAAGAMWATKETAGLTLGAAAVALLAVGLWHRVSRRTPATNQTSPDRPPPRRINPGHFLAGGTASVATAWAVLTGLGRDPGAAWASVRALALQGHTGLHDHPWHFYLERLAWFHPEPGPWWSEALILGLAAVGLVAALTGLGPARRQPWPGRFLAIATLLLTATYSVISHKTPWCVLSPLLGLILLAGLGAVWLIRLAPGRIGRAIVAALLAVGLAHLGWQAWRATGRFAADPRNPWVYAQTVRDAARLGRRVEALAAVRRITGPAADAPGLRVNVVAPADDTWPVPWYLRRLDRDRIGYWTDPEPALAPPARTAPVWIVAEDHLEPIQAALGPDFHASVFGLRPDVRLWVLVEPSLWRAFLATPIHTRSARARKE